MNLRTKLDELFKSAGSVEERVRADADGLLLEATWKVMRSVKKCFGQGDRDGSSQQKA